jgi:hypothetical protein
MKLLGSPSSNLIEIVKLPNSVLQFVGLIEIYVLETILTNEGPLDILVVNVNPSGSIAVGNVYNSIFPFIAIISVGTLYVSCGGRLVTVTVKTALDESPLLSVR